MRPGERQIVYALQVFPPGEVIGESLVVEDRAGVVAKLGPGHFQGLEDVFPGPVGERPAARALDRFGQQVVVGIGVLEAVAGRKRKPLLGFDDL